MRRMIRVVLSGFSNRGNIEEFTPGAAATTWTFLDVDVSLYEDIMKKIK